MTVSKSLKKLAASHLVHRIEHKMDTRAKNVSLTAKGRTLISQLIPLIEQIDAEFFGKGISKKNQSLFLGVLRKLLA